MNYTYARGWGYVPPVSFKKLLVVALAGAVVCHAIWAGTWMVLDYIFI